MTYTNHPQHLQQLAAELADQNQAFDAVKAALSGLDERSLIHVGKAWSDAFRVATDNEPLRVGFVPAGALRA
jgi:hypothetical protein